MYVLGAVVCCGFGIYVSGLETVPYTKRRHSLLISIAREREFGSQTFEQVRCGPFPAKVCWLTKGYINIDWRG